MIITLVNLSVPTYSGYMEVIINHPHTEAWQTPLKKLQIGTSRFSAQPRVMETLFLQTITKYHS